MNCDPPQSCEWEGLAFLIDMAAVFIVGIVYLVLAFFMRFAYRHFIWKGASPAIGWENLDLGAGIAWDRAGWAAGFYARDNHPPLGLVRPLAAPGHSQRSASPARHPAGACLPAAWSSRKSSPALFWYLQRRYARQRSRACPVRPFLQYSPATRNWECYLAGRKWSAGIEAAPRPDTRLRRWMRSMAGRAAASRSSR